MSIVISEKILGTWYVPFTGGDWLAAIERGSDAYHLIYRFRYYVDDKSFDSDDTKNWYEGDISLDTDEAVIEHMRDMVDKIVNFLGTTEETAPVELLMEGDDLDGFVARLKECEFTNFKAESVH